MKKLLVAVTLLLAAIVTVGALGAPDASTPATPRPATVSAGPASQATLQQDAFMTQQMSVAGADGPMQDYAMADSQLRHSQNPAFVRQLEQYRAQIDRMLARPTP